MPTRWVLLIMTMGYPVDGYPVDDDFLLTAEVQNVLRKADGGPEGPKDRPTQPVANQIRVGQALAGVWLAPRCTTNPT